MSRSVLLIEIKSSKNLNFPAFFQYQSNLRRNSIHHFLFHRILQSGIVRNHIGIHQFRKFEEKSQKDGPCRRTRLSIGNARLEVRQLDRKKQILMEIIWFFWMLTFFRTIISLSSLAEEARNLFLCCMVPSCLKQYVDKNENILRHWFLNLFHSFQRFQLIQFFCCWNWKVRFQIILFGCNF